MSGQPRPVVSPARGGLLGAVARLVTRTRSLGRQAGRLLVAEARLAGQEAREELLVSNLRALIFLATALLSLIWLVAMAGVVVVIAVPPADRLLVAAAVAVLWLLSAVVLGLLGLRALRGPDRLLRSWKGELAWAVTLLKRAVS